MNPANPTNPPQLKEVQAIAPALGVTLLSLKAKGIDDIARAFTAMKKGAQRRRLVIGGAPGNHGPRIAEVAVKNRLPTIWSSSNAVDPWRPDVLWNEFR